MSLATRRARAVLQSNYFLLRDAYFTWQGIFEPSEIVYTVAAHLAERVIGEAILQRWQEYRSDER